MNTKRVVFLLFSLSVLTSSVCAQSTPEAGLLHSLIFGHRNMGLADTPDDVLNQQIADHGDDVRNLILAELILPDNNNLLMYTEIGGRYTALVLAMGRLDAKSDPAFLDDSYATVSSQLDMLYDMLEAAELNGTEAEILETRNAIEGALSIHNAIVTAFRVLSDDRILDDALSMIGRVGFIGKTRIADYYEKITSIRPHFEYLFLDDGWNMISLPLKPIGSDYFDDLFSDAPLATEPATWEEPNYVFEEFMSVGKGYWVKRDTDTHYQKIVGLPDTLITLNLADGWNLIGGPHCSIGYLHEHQIIDNENIIINNTLYTDDDGWSLETTLNVGVGYWIKTSQAGEIEMNCVAHQASKRGPVAAPVVPDDFLLISVSDASGSSQDLYLGGDLISDRQQSYELPPARPQAAGFDARFSDNTWLLEQSEAEIKIQSTSYPITIKLPDDATEQQFLIEELVSGQVVNTYNWQGGAVFEITDSRVTAIRIKPL